MVLVNFRPVLIRLGMIRATRNMVVRIPKESKSTSRRLNTTQGHAASTSHSSNPQINVESCA